MARDKLTAREIMAAREGEYLSDDDDADGLRVVWKKKAKVRLEPYFIFRYTSPVSGRRREVGFGFVHRGGLKQAGESLVEARLRAQPMRLLLAQGLDPLDENRRRRQAEQVKHEAKKAERQREQLTLVRWTRDYHGRVIEPKLSTKHAANWIKSLELHVAPSVWNAPIASITPPALLAALLKVRAIDAPSSRIDVTLRRLRQRLEKVFANAMFYGHCSTNPALAIRHEMSEELPKAKRGELAALPYRQAPAFMVKLRDAEGIAARCLEFALLTAARTNEVLLATWSELDLALIAEDGTPAPVWVIPGARMKAGEQHVVALSTQAVSVLRGQIGLDVNYIFPSPVLTGRPMSNMAMLAVLDRMGMRDRTTVHGVCRATFSTWANETAVARPDVIEACLAHREADLVKKAYNRAKFSDARRLLLQSWADYLGKPAASNVVPMRVA